jgi:hypothetical protein
MTRAMLSVAMTEPRFAGAGEDLGRHRPLRMSFLARTDRRRRAEIPNAPVKHGQAFQLAKPTRRRRFRGTALANGGLIAIG